MNRNSDLIDSSNSESRSVHRISVGLGMAAAYAVSIVLLWYARDVFFIAFAGILFAVFLSSLAGWLARHSFLSHTWGLVVTVIGLFTCLVLIGWLVQSRLLTEVQQFGGQANDAWTKLTDQLRNSGWGQWLLRYLPEGQKLWGEVASLSRINQILSTTLGAIVAVIVVLFVGLYGAAQPHWYRAGLVHLVVPSKRDRVRQVLDAISYNLRWWIGGQLISMTCVGLLVGLAMWLLGVPLPLTLAIIAFLLEFIPNLGPVLAAIPAVLLAWGGGGSRLALWALLVYIVIQLLESYVITPLVYKKAVWLPPALFLVSVMLFGLIGGFLGVLLAAPLTVTLLVLIKTLYVEDALGDQSIDVPGEPG